jgi:hypothetical protein
MALGGKKDRGCGRADVGTPLTRRMLKGPRLPRVSSRLGPGPSHHVPFFQKIPNSILVSLVQERLNEDDCLRKVRLPGPVWHNAAQLGCLQAKGGGVCPFSRVALRGYREDKALN